MATRRSPAAPDTSVDTETSTALAERPTTNSAMAVAGGFDRTDRRGKGEMTQKNMRMPRIALAQKTSKQLERGTDDFIEGLELYDMFNTLTFENYGKGPIDICIIRRNEKAMQFDADLKVIDRNVPLTDRRLDWTDGPKGPKTVQPLATLFQEYLVLILPDLTPAMLSMKRTQLGVAAKLNSLIEYRPGPAFAGLYELKSTSKPHGNFTSGQYVVRPKGKTPDAIVEIAEHWFTRTEGVELETDRDAERGDVVDTTASEPADDDIPFS